MRLREEDILINEKERRVLEETNTLADSLEVLIGMKIKFTLCDFLFFQPLAEKIKNHKE